MPIRQILLLSVSFLLLFFTPLLSHADDVDDFNTIDPYADGRDYPFSSEVDDEQQETIAGPFEEEHAFRSAAPFQQETDRSDEEGFESESDTTFFRLPKHMTAPGEKLIVVDPHQHAWGAYSASGTLLRSGLSTAGGNWCHDTDRSCRTTSGVFRLYSLGSFDCISHKYPLGRGGAPMPYCMFFNGGQGLHGSYQVVDRNVSHGCVRMHVDDAEWLRFNFAQIGTKVWVKKY